MLLVGDELADLFVGNTFAGQPTDTVNQFFLGSNAAENGWFTEVTDSEITQTIGCPFQGKCAHLSLDADADGNMDLMVTGYGSSTEPGIYYGDGEGGFPASISLGRRLGTPVDAVASDFNEVSSTSITRAF